MPPNARVGAMARVARLCVHNRLCALQPPATLGRQWANTRGKHRSNVPRAESPPSPTTPSHSRSISLSLPFPLRSLQPSSLSPLLPLSNPLHALRQPSCTGALAPGASHTHQRLHLVGREGSNGEGGVWGGAVAEQDPPA
eukprot:scaffold55875_cov26-Tisochrysis_lutea.AAC.1